MWPRGVVYMRPGVGSVTRDGGKPPTQVGNKVVTYGAGIPRPVVDARLDYDEGQPRLHHGKGDIVVGVVFGALVLCRPSAARVEAVALVHQLAARVGEDDEGTGVDDSGHSQLLREFEDVPRAIHVDALGHALVGHTNLIPRGHVEDAIHACHPLARTGFVGDVAGVERCTRLAQVGGIGGVPREGADLMARFEKLPSHAPANEARCACEEVFHGVLLSGLLRITSRTAGEFTLRVL